MIRIEKSFDGTVAKLTGDQVEMMLFFCFWQTALWPDWVKMLTRGHQAIRSHKIVITVMVDCF